MKQAHCFLDVLSFPLQKMTLLLHVETLVHLGMWIVWASKSSRSVINISHYRFQSVGRSCFPREHLMDGWASVIWNHTIHPVDQQSQGSGAEGLIGTYIRDNVESVSLKASWENSWTLYKRCCIDWMTLMFASQWKHFRSWACLEPLCSFLNNLHSQKIFME